MHNCRPAKPCARPAGHMSHEIPPDFGWNFPWVHFVQLCSAVALRWICPGAHAAHWNRLEGYAPALHAVTSLVHRALAALLPKPCSHPLHELSCVRLYLPGAHMVQANALWGATRPGGHVEQKPAPCCAIVPGLHAVQAACPYVLK